MALKNVYFDTWEEYVNFVNDQIKIIENIDKNTGNLVTEEQLNK